MDQPAGLLERMTAALNTYNACKAFSKNAHNQEWKKSNWETIDFVNKLAIMEKDGKKFN